MFDDCQPAPEQPERAQGLIDVATSMPSGAIRQFVPEPGEPDKPLQLAFVK
jgi:hypothetical protein